MTEAKRKILSIRKALKIAELTIKGYQAAVKGDFIGLFNAHVMLHRVIATSLTQFEKAMEV